MGHEIVYCSRCQSRLTSADFDRGTGVRLSNYVLCFTCLTEEEKAGLRKPQAHTASRLPAITPRSFPAATGSPRGEPQKRPPVVVWASVGGAVVLAIIVVLVLSLKGTDKPSTAAVPPVPPTPAPTPPAPKDFRPELETIQADLRPPLSQNNFRFARAVLDRSRTLHSEEAWKKAIDELDRQLSDRARARFNEIKGSAEKSVAREAFDEVRDARSEISAWGPTFQPLLKEFEETFAAALAARPTVPDPVKPDPVKPPDPPPTEPVRTEAGKRYFEEWKKAMESAARRDYARAVADLRAAGQGLKEEDLRKEYDGDLRDLERLQALLPEMVKTASTLRTWEDVALDVTQEDGSRAKVKGSILLAGARRLELRSAPRFVEIGDIAPGSLARIFVKKKGKPAAEDAKALALFCALDRDADGAKEMAALSPKLKELAASARAPAEAGKSREWAAKKLFHEAETEFRALETRGAALEKFARLLADFADTEFVRASRTDVDARIEETRDYTFGAARLTGKGVFAPQKLAVAIGKDKIEMGGWRSKEDPAPDDATSAVEVTFFAPAGVEYKAWALVGGCCATTFSWYLQANELTYLDKKTRKPLACDPGSNYAAPWEHRLKSVNPLHGGKGHAKAEKEPTTWEWLEVPISKFTLAGPKTIRFLGASKGQAIAAVIVSASREKRPAFEEARKIAETPSDEAVPTSNLRAGKGEPDLLAQIPEARAYQLVYDLDLAKLKKPAVYDVDRRADATKPFDRIAYLLELQKGTGPVQYVFVSMEAFTDDPGKIGIPDVATGASFQQMVASLNVHSNVEGVPTGIDLDGGNIEFWPNNYGPTNGKKIPGASNDKYDFGDGIGQPVDGYGCMQVHHHKSGQTIFAINHWSQGKTAEIGIGNSPTGNPDYTFTSNGGQYSFKRLRVLVRPKA